MQLLRATTDDIPAVLNIYNEVRGKGFCVWSENYPSAEHALRDALAGGLYVLKLSGEIVACASVEPIAEDDDLPFWRINDGTHREVARVAVAPAHQGKRLSQTLMRLLLEALKREGVRSVHLLAARKNPPAVRTYRALGFDFIGECHRYGADYFVCEKILCDLDYQS